jgi:Fe-S-cluster containining protein
MRNAMERIREGLRFECSGCGGCCTGAPGTVGVTDAEIDTISSFLKMSRREFMANCVERMPGGYSLRERKNYDCWFFAEKKCSIYPVRPMQCRTWPFWLQNLRSDTRWREAAEECPGIGQGRLVSMEEILETLERSPL